MSREWTAGIDADKRVQIAGGLSRVLADTYTL
jgi:hypothetical protein